MSRASISLDKPSAKQVVLKSSSRLHYRRILFTIRLKIEGRRLLRACCSWCFCLWQRWKTRKMATPSRCRHESILRSLTLQQRYASTKHIMDGLCSSFRLSPAAGSVLLWHVGFQRGNRDLKSVFPTVLMIDAISDR